jgi:hypothetical protein
MKRMSYYLALIGFLLVNSIFLCHSDLNLLECILEEVGLVCGLLHLLDKGEDE